MIQFSNCKINLGLHITAKRSDGFHDLSTCFFPVPMHDVLEAVPASSFSFMSHGLLIDSTSENNLCVKAVRLLANDYPQVLQSALHLLKNIPMGAGVGGGSANATHTLHLYNKKYNLQLTQQQLLQYAAQLGSDCSFFVYNTSCVAEGRGEILEPVVVSLSGYKLVLIFSDIHVSTRDAFEGCAVATPTVSIKEIIQKPVAAWKDLLVNDFEKTVFAKHPALAATKQKLYELGATYASMSGSGSCIYALFDSSSATNAIAASFANYHIIEL
jgi:4-diphosphocytidyl-2-C-methyl-D-erythritol kinase